MNHLNQNQEAKKSGNTVYTIIGIILLLALAFVFFGNTKDKDIINDNDSMMESEGQMMQQDKGKMMQENEVMMKEDSVMMKESENKADISMQSGDDAIMTKSGTYEMYSSEKLSMAEKGKVVIFFKADWCPTCRALDADIKANMEKIPEGVAILEVDYDKSNDLKKKYGVTTQHTLVQVDADGKLISKWSGSSNLSELLTKIQ